MKSGAPGNIGSNLFFPAKEISGVSHVENRQIQALARLAFRRDGELAGDAFDGGGGEIFDDAHAGLGFEDHHQHAMFINVDDEQAEFVALLVNAVEIRLIDQAGDGLVGQERAGGQRGDGGQVEVMPAAVMRDEKAALVNDERRRGLRSGGELLERFVEPQDVVLDELW